MKSKFSLVLILTLFTLSSVNAQSLYFCEDVDEDGYAINSSSTFTITEDGGSLKMLVRMGEDVDVYGVYFKIFEVDSNSDESYDNTIYQDVEPDWTWFWKEIIFYRSGKYNVYVYDEYDEYITSGTIKIKMR
ncbi:MAG: hypothetical protein IPM56_06905 [Ignavibacteriales bacterium]|nr:MAG: hypothetical protein IPM56_06905 [Ignavibacteriales bacterium]